MYSINVGMTITDRSLGADHPGSLPSAKVEWIYC